HTVATLNMQPWANANFSADPLLDATFHLGAGSPCIDAGTTTEAPANDIDGDARPRGAGIDVGPDEAQ
ncbi:MAG TPA: choice-of-anchor Q domain-containing protein, partial [Candidatus Binatus sp.]|nr:choice-of-anchor Q domain-containing protein [Candidatus Binatus sp.]